MNDEYGLKAIQEVNLGILKFIDKTCNELNLKYYLAFGTLLGAIRHHGFIPWDDDADVWMTRKDFTTLYNHLLHDDKNNRYRMCLDQQTIVPMRLQMKVYDTAYAIKRRLWAQEIQTHPWVDIFVLDNVPHGLGKWMYYFQARLLNSILVRLRARNRNTASISESLLYNLLSKHSNITQKEDAFYFTYAFCYLEQINKVMYPCSYFKSVDKVAFEDTFFCIPSDYDLILKCLYGDYLTPPPSHLREAKHHVDLIKN